MGLRVRISVGVGAQGWGRGCGYGQVMVHCGDSVGGVVMDGRRCGLRQAKVGSCCSASTH